MDVTKILLILLGGALGTGCRYWLSTFVYSVVEKPSFSFIRPVSTAAPPLVVIPAVDSHAKL
jgi:hypothetical protein